MWLLNIGSGNLPEISGLKCDSIEIPQQMAVEKNLIEAIYSENLNDMEVEQLSKRVILAPTNKKTLEMNQSIIVKNYRMSLIPFLQILFINIQISERPAKLST
ncbi:hypothetical protein AVEN_91477-1 [Araneus ventricosus]|uniref:ATP-dependent DNA helicase n=1 Tax=Araneus ventricosus TaxID=182803 RepID=A0A4Y2BL64_ARAVE|nr:hypothetical protein AVEN_91477-1 [Araneus ventricosus]